MTNAVSDQDISAPDKAVSDKEYNFRRLEEAREKEREQREREKEARIRAEIERDRYVQEINELKELLKPKEVDPFDDEDFDPDLRSRIEKKLDKERQSFERKAQQIAEETYQRKTAEKEQAAKKDFNTRLRESYPDIDKVITESSLKDLAEKDSVFLESVLAIPDDFIKRELTYKRLKSMSAPKVDEVQKKIDQNVRNPHVIPDTAIPCSSGLDFDVRSPQARQSAYEALKAAQRRPIEPRPIR